LSNKLTNQQSTKNLKISKGVAIAMSFCSKMLSAGRIRDKATKRYNKSKSIFNQFPQIRVTLSLKDLNVILTKYMSTIRLKKIP